MANTLVTAPETALISTDDAKLFLRVDHDTEDDLIDSLVTAATNYGQAYLDQQFITATRREDLSGFPPVLLRLPYSPLQSITHVKYYDTSNELQTLDSSYYEADIVSIPGRLLLAYAYTWPDTYQRHDAVQITYTCGYGDDVTDVPENIIVAGKQLIHEWYTHREAKGNGCDSANLLFGISSHGWCA